MRFLFLPLLFITLACSAQNDMPDQSIHAEFSFELEKYLGTWYEIARFDHRFERDLEFVTATYSLNEDGSIKVMNQGIKNGKSKTAIGKARLAKNGVNRNLEVSFFWIFYGPYNILELDKDYQLALIGSNSSDYLWILSRQPQPDSNSINELLEKAKKRGYDTSKLIFVEQKKE
jgi:apolipoprotein D and lipocalin family protein